MNGVTFTTDLRPRDVFAVSLRLLVFHPVSITLIVAGPALFALGAVSGSETVTRLGSTMSWLVVLVPAFGLLAASYSAYRPGSGKLYQPAQWRMGDHGVDVAQPGREARAQWQEFTGWKSVGAYLLLHTAATRYVVLPWRDLAEGTRPEVEALLARELGARRR